MRKFNQLLIQTEKQMSASYSQQRSKPGTEVQKELPSTEYSLKSISWHLKTIAEELKRLNDKLDDRGPGTSPF